jgi:predicted GIY-YIG superfamily endonuclease
VDFAEQLGVYLLYDRRDVVYVGRTDTRRLGKRLYEHTTDRLSGRWDRFSWFGLCPVTKEGKLGEPAIRLNDAEALTKVLEAILI